jgi:predicted Fe-Mo cluster-binding NifX family protein
MIVAVASNQKSIDSKIDGCFGKARYIFMADTDTRIVKIIDNSSFANLKSGSGIKTAEMLLKLKIQKLAVKEIGEEASEILKNGNIEVFSNCSGTVRDILDYFALSK